MEIPVSETFRSGDDLQPVTLQLTDEHLSWLRAIARRREITLDQTLQYLLDICQNATAAARKRTGTNHPPKDRSGQGKKSRPDSNDRDESVLNHLRGQFPEGAGNSDGRATPSHSTSANESSGGTRPESSSANGSSEDASAPEERPSQSGDENKPASFFELVLSDERTVPSSRDTSSSGRD